MRAGMEARGLEVVPDVFDDRRRLGRQRHGRARHEAVDVVDPEADAFQMKRSDRAFERFGFVEERFQLTGARRIGAQQRDEIAETALRRLAAVGAQDLIIVECRTWKRDARASSHPTSVRRAG